MKVGVIIVAVLFGVRAGQGGRVAVAVVVLVIAGLGGLTAVGSQIAGLWGFAVLVRAAVACVEDS